MKLIFFEIKLDLIIMFLVANWLISYLINYWAAGQGESSLLNIWSLFQPADGNKENPSAQINVKPFGVLEGIDSDSILLKWQDDEVTDFGYDRLLAIVQKTIIKHCSNQELSPVCPVFSVQNASKKHFKWILSGAPCSLHTPPHKASQLKSVQCERAVCDSCIRLFIMVW